METKYLEKKRGKQQIIERGNFGVQSKQLRESFLFCREN